MTLSHLDAAHLHSARLPLTVSSMTGETDSRPATQFIETLSDPTKYTPDLRDWLIGISPFGWPEQGSQTGKS